MSDAFARGLRFLRRLLRCTLTCLEPAATKTLYSPQEMSARGPDHIMETDTNNTQLEQLCKLLTDPRAIQLELQLEAFNPFTVLRANRYEIRHTNTLAWLLDPEGNHGLGDTFLRSFLREALPGTVLAVVLPHLLNAKGELTIHREYRIQKSSDQGGNSARALDILIEHGEFLIAVEAKIDAGQSNGQLTAYQRGLNDTIQYRQQCKHFLYLTLHEDPLDSKSDWINVLWKNCVLGPLTWMVKSDFICSTMGEPQRYFIQSYVDSLKEIYAEPDDDVATWTSELLAEFPNAIGWLKPPTSEGSSDSEIEAIRLRHSTLLNHLISKVESPESTRAKDIRELLRKNGCTTCNSLVNYIHFLPKEWDSRKCRELFSCSRETDKPLIYFEVVNRRKGPPFIRLTFARISERDAETIRVLRREVWNALQEVVKKLEVEEQGWSSLLGSAEPKDGYQTVWSTFEVWKDDKLASDFLRQLEMPIKVLGEALNVQQRREFPGALSAGS
jgi:hypothetical protein